MAVSGSFIPQDISNTLWAYATLGRAPLEDVLRGLEGRAVAVAGSFIPQEISNTLWAYANLGRVQTTSCGVDMPLDLVTQIILGDTDTNVLKPIRCLWKKKSNSG